MNRCRAKTQSGSPCRGYAVMGSAFCFTHEPSRARERAAAHKRGGENRPRPVYPDSFPPGVDPKTGAGLLTLLEYVMKDIWTLESSVTRARTLGYLAQVQKGILEIGELEGRVNALETALTARLEGHREKP